MLGRKIKALRTAKGITQVELAKALGFTSSGAISQVEAGHRGLSLESILMAAKALDVHPGVLTAPDEMDRDDMELVSATFRLFEKRKVCPHIEEIRKILRRAIYDG
jgi:transcriptional regulator with XRE-family HTH domain